MTPANISNEIIKRVQMLLFLREYVPKLLIKDEQKEHLIK